MSDNDKRRQRVVLAHKRQAALALRAKTLAREAQEEKIVQQIEKAYLQRKKVNDQIKRLKAVAIAHPNPLILAATAREQQRLPKTVAEYGSRFRIPEGVAYSRKYIKRETGRPYAYNEEYVAPKVRNEFVYGTYAKRFGVAKRRRLV